MLLKRNVSILFYAMTAGGSAPFFSSSFSKSDEVERTRSSSMGRQARTGLRFLAAGQSLLEIDETPGLYIIISGEVEVLFCGHHAPHVQKGWGAGSNTTPSFLSRHRFASPTIFSDGDCLGQISLLVGNSTEWYGQRKEGSVRHPVLAVKARCNTWLVKVSRYTYEKAVSEHPEVIFHFSDRVISVLPPMIRLFDFCTKWVNLKGGEDIVKRGELSKGKLYIVLFGTLLCLVNEAPSKEDIESRRDSSYGEDSKSSGHVHRDDEASSGYFQLGGGEREGHIFGRGTLIGRAVSC